MIYYFSVNVGMELKQNALQKQGSKAAFGQ